MCVRGLTFVSFLGLFLIYRLILSRAVVLMGTKDQYGGTTGVGQMLCFGQGVNLVLG